MSSLYIFEAGMTVKSSDSEVGLPEFIVFTPYNFHSLGKVT